MKKLSLWLIIALLISGLIAASRTKLVRLTIFNDSGETVYMKLQGKYTKAFYYLTVPDEGEKTFTVQSDDYRRTTWSCDGLVNSGRLIMTGNVRLRFIKCYTIPWRMGYKWVWTDTNSDGVGDAWVYTYGKWLNQGEPTMEKVAYFSYYFVSHWSGNCGIWTVLKTKVKIPNGCNFRYRY